MPVWARVLLDRSLVAALTRDGEPDGCRKRSPLLEAGTTGEVTVLAGDVELHDVHTLGCEVQQERESLRGATVAVGAASVLHIRDIRRQDGRRFGEVMQDVDRITAVEGDAFQATNLAHAPSAVLEVHAGCGRSQCGNDRASQGADRYHLLDALALADPGHGVTQGQTALSIRVVDLDSHTVERGEHVVGTVGVGADHVLSDGPDKNHRTPQQLAVQCQVRGGSEDASTTTHVTLHGPSVRALDVQATGVEHQGLAHVGHHIVGRAAERIDPDGHHSEVTTVTSSYRADQTHLGVLILAGLRDSETQVTKVTSHQIREVADREQVRRQRTEPTTDVGRACEPQPLLDRGELILCGEEGHLLDPEVRDLGLQFVGAKQCTLHPHGRELEIDVLQRHPEDDVLATQLLRLEGRRSEQGHHVLGEEHARVLADADHQATVREADAAFGQLADLELNPHLARFSSNDSNTLELGACPPQDLSDTSVNPGRDVFMSLDKSKVVHDIFHVASVGPRRPEIRLLPHVRQALLYLRICMY
jgi:hypothetical protein